MPVAHTHLIKIDSPQVPFKDSDTSFSVDINSPLKSLKHIILIFTKERSATEFEPDTEKFESSLNELYAQNMPPF